MPTRTHRRDALLFSRYANDCRVCTRMQPVDYVRGFVAHRVAQLPLAGLLSYGLPSLATEALDFQY